MITLSHCSFGLDAATSVNSVGPASSGFGGGSNLIELGTLWIGGRHHPNLQHHPSLCRKQRTKTLSQLMEVGYQDAVHVSTNPGEGLADSGAWSEDSTTHGTDTSQTMSCFSTT